MTKDARLVYSTDPNVQKCPKCKELTCQCVPEDKVPAKGLTVVMRIEKQGRNGKSVTVIDRFPRQEAYLQGLTTELKKKCGSGGTFRMGEKDALIEIQGDKRELVRALLEKKGLKVKG